MTQLLAPTLSLSCVVVIFDGVLTTAVTSCPAASDRATNCCPDGPVAPRITNFIVANVQKKKKKKKKKEEEEEEEEDKRIKYTTSVPICRTSNVIFCEFSAEV